MSVGTKKGSSLCIEFFLSLLVGVAAITGGLFIVGFLLVEPIRHPPSERTPTINIEDLIETCEPQTRLITLPHGCTLNNEQIINQAVCSNRQCDCDPDNDAAVCCCRSLRSEPVSPLVCPQGIFPPTLTSSTLCGCSSCDDLTLQVHITVINRDSDEPVAAATLLRIDSASNSIDMLGLTTNTGRFMYTESVGREWLELKTIASGYVPQIVEPIRLEPHLRVLQLRIIMIPSMSFMVGLGGSDIVVRLGTMMSVSFPAGSFHTSDGEEYEDTVHFNGVFLTPSDPNGLTGVPGSKSSVMDPNTGKEQIYGMLCVFRIEFIGSEGQQLTPHQYQMQFSTQNTDGESPDLCLLTYNESTHIWEKFADFSKTTDSRSRRQSSQPIVLEGDNIPLVIFAAVAQPNNVNCWLQGRTFTSDGMPLTNRFLSLEYTAIRSGGVQLFRLGTNTGAQTLEGILNNALCLPVDCGPLNSGTISSRLSNNDATSPLAPIPFPATTFNSTEMAPIPFGTVFSFEDVIVADNGRERPFYSSQGQCTTTGVDASASNSSFFSFEEVGNIPVPLANHSCFIKIQIRGCSSSNTVRITSVQPGNGLIDASETVTVDEFEFTDMPASSGDMPTTESVTTPGPSGCNEQTATLRGACLPYTCGDQVQVVVLPNPENGQTRECNIIDRSVRISLIEDGIDDNNQLIVSSDELVVSDFNNPELGLYYEAGSSAMAVMTAEELCNAGDGISSSSEIDVTQGWAVTFGCFDP